MVQPELSQHLTEWRSLGRVQEGSLAYYVVGVVARARPQSDNECQLLQGPQSSTLTTRQDRAALLSLQAVVHAR